ncbi:MAG TPA: acyl carrier protein [Pseudonocardiaceae bacterium]
MNTDTMNADTLIAPPTVRAESLDCIQANLAVLADRWYGTDAHLALGAELTFRPTFGADGLATVEPTLDEQLDRAQRLLGFGITARYPGVGVDTLRSLTQRHGVLYVVADAFYMPWVPYRGHRHLDHSFLVESAAGATVVDAYLNRTPWGVAEPGWWLLPWEDLPATLNAMRLAPAPSGPPATAPLVDIAGPDERARYLSGYAQHPDREHALDRLTLETWLLARSRRLHANFLAWHGDSVGPEVDEHLRQWDLLVERTYLALRRVQSDRAEPDGVLPRLAALLDADEHVFHHSAAEPAPRDHRAGPDDRVDGAAHRAVVTEVVAGVLGTEPARLLDTPALTELSAFNSFRVVEIVEALEHRLAIEFDPADLVPEHLHHLDDLCRLVAARCTTTEGDR